MDSEKASAGFGLLRELLGVFLFLFMLEPKSKNSFCFAEVKLHGLSSCFFQAVAFSSCSSAWQDCSLLAFSSFASRAMEISQAVFRLLQQNSFTLLLCVLHILQSFLHFSFTGLVQACLEPFQCLLPLLSFLTCLSWQAAHSHQGFASLQQLFSAGPERDCAAFFRLL